jgi:hypothetical protein
MNVFPVPVASVSKTRCDGVGSAGLLREPMKVRKELLIDEVAKVVAGHGGVVVGLTILPLRGGPGFPAIGLVEDIGVLLTLKLRLCGLVLLQSIEVLEKEEPRGLLGVI